MHPNNELSNWVGVRSSRQLAIKILFFLAVQIIFSVFFSPAFAENASRNLKDDHHQIVSLKQPATRIITLAPFLTELVYVAGAGDQLAAVSAWSDYPQDAKTKPVIGDASAIDMERLVALKPDLVIAWKGGGHPADTERLAKFGIPVFMADANKLNDIPRLLRIIGQLAGTHATAETAASQFEQRLAALKQRYSSGAPKKVFFEIWHQPLITVNGRHFISEAMGVCGGKNIFADVRSLTPTVGMESIFALNPQAIITSTSADGENSLSEWGAQHKLEAVKKGNVFAIHPDVIQRQTPRILDGVERMCGMLEKLK